MSQTSIIQLANNLKVVHTQINNPVTHCGFIINVGSRDEYDNEQGLAHFIEHSFFKGTKKRKSYHVLSSLDSVGGELNAYTSKEETVVYASFQEDHHKKAFDILGDIIFNSTFPEKEIEKEKDIIIDEIFSYLDSPSEQIFDDFEELLFKNQPIGRNILGTEESVKSFNREHVLNFIQRNYHLGNIVFSYTGPWSLKKVENLAQKMFGDVEIPEQKEKENKVISYNQFHESFEKDTHQCHVLIGNQALSLKDKRRRELYLLNNVLGGPALNNRLNLNIREKYGFTYNLESNYQPFTDCGYFNIYFGTDKSHLKKTTSLVLKELKKLRENKFGSLQLHKAKIQLKGHMALANENQNNNMVNQGKAVLIYNSIDTVEVVYRSIDAITASDLLDLANRLFIEDELSYLIYQ